MISETKLRVPVSQADHSIGQQSAPIVLLEYGDCECPFCGRAYQVVNRLIRDLKGDVRYVFRNFPLAEIHPHAMNAARAVEAAALQGKFWQMHDMLFENQDNLDDESLITYA